MATRQGGSRQAVSPSRLNAGFHISHCGTAAFERPPCWMKPTHTAVPAITSRSDSKTPVAIRNSVVYQSIPLIFPQTVRQATTTSENQRLISVFQGLPTVSFCNTPEFSHLLLWSPNAFSIKGLHVRKGPGTVCALEDTCESRHRTGQDSRSPDSSNRMLLSRNRYSSNGLIRAGTPGMPM